MAGIKMRSKTHLGTMLSESTYLPNMPQELVIENQYGQYFFRLVTIKPPKEPKRMLKDVKRDAKRNDMQNTPGNNENNNSIPNKHA